MYDLVIRNGKIVDGSGEASFMGDIAIKGDRIVKIGLVEDKGNKEIDGDLIIISIICIGFYANFLPWAIASRSTFIHHFQPSACFAFMALAFLLFKASNKNKFENRGFVLSILVLIIISTIYWLPLQLGIPISSESFYSRMWFESWI